MLLLARPKTDLVILLIFIRMPSPVVFMKMLGDKIKLIKLFTCKRFP